MFTSSTRLKKWPLAMTLLVGQVYAALAYYYMHKAEIDQDMREDAARAEKLIEELDKQGKVIRLE